MKKLFAFGNRYAKQSTWKDFALTKLCLFSMGLAIGTLVSGGYRKAVLVASIIAFVAAYIPLILRMIQVARDKEPIRPDNGESGWAPGASGQCSEEALQDRNALEGEPPRDGVQEDEP